MSEAVMMIGYGCISKKDFDKVLMTTKLLESDDADDTVDGIIECGWYNDDYIEGGIERDFSGETGIVFLGFEIDEDRRLVGLPNITDEKKSKVHDMYEAFPQEIKDRLEPPNWVFVAFSS